MVTEVLDKSLLVTSAQLEEAPERPAVKPFVGKLVKWATRTQTFTQKNKEGVDEEIETRYLRLWFDPQNAVAPWEDGLYMAEWRMSRRVDSTYGRLMAAFDAAIAATTGIPGKKFVDPEEVIGLLFHVGEVEPKDDFWAATYTDKKGNTQPYVRPENRERMTRRVMAVLGAPPANWEATIPANLTELKLQAMQKAAARRADREAASGGGVSSSAATTVPSFTETASTLDLTGVEDDVLAFLAGKSETDNLVLKAMTDPSLKSATGDRHQAIVFGLGDKSVQGRLIAAGRLSVDATGIYSTN